MRFVKNLFDNKKIVNPENLIYLIFFIGMLWRSYAQIYYHIHLQLIDDFQWQSWLYRIGLGQIPYKDFFVVYGFLLPYLFYLPFKILGGNFLAWNIVRYLLLPVVCYIFAVLIAKKIFRSVFFRVCFFLIASTYDAWSFFYLQPWEFRIWLSLIMILILFSRHKMNFFYAGIWTSTILFCSVEQGIYLFAASTIYLFIKTLFFGEKNNISVRCQSFINYFFGLSVALLFGLTFLLLTGGIENFIYLSQVNASMAYTRYSLVFPNFPFKLLATNMLSFIVSIDFRFYVPLIIYVFTLLYLLYLFSRSRCNLAAKGKILFLTIFGCISYKTILGADFGHLAFASIPAVIIVVWLAEEACVTISSFLNSKINPKNILYSLMLVIFIFSIFLYFFLTRAFAEKGFLVLFNPNEIIQSRKKSADTFNATLGVWMPYYQSTNLNEVLEFLKSNSNNKYYTHGSLSGIYFLTDSINNFYYDQDYFATEKNQKKIISSLESQNNQYAVMPASYSLSRGSVLDDYFQYFYDIVFKNEEYMVLRRNKNIFQTVFFQKGLFKTLNFNSMKNVGDEFIINLDSHVIRKIDVWIDLQYLPLLENIALAQVKLGVFDQNGLIEWFDSDYKFIPKNNEKTMTTFHLYKSVLTNKLILSFSAPGGLNPKPTKIKIHKINIYE